MENPNYAEIVSEAAKWLDGVEPGWHKKIDRETLDIGDCEYGCVLGQLYGDYLAGRRYHNRRNSWEFKRHLDAFDNLGIEGVDNNEQVFRVKTQLWLREIDSRLKADARQADKSADAFITRTNEIINLPARVTDTLPVEVSK